MIDPISLQFPYNYLANNYRLLWHQTRDEILRYPEVARRTNNFDIYPVFKSKRNTQVTLGSTIVTRHFSTIEDCIITEIWLADDLSMRAGFFYELKKFFNAAKANADYVIWYPRDKTDKAFAVEFIDLSVGDTDNMEVTPVHNGTSKKDYRWLRSEVRLQFKIVKLVTIPDAVATFEGV